MPRIQVSGTEGATWTPLPKGTYAMQIDDVRIEQAKSSGNQQLRVSMSVLSSEEHGSEYDGRTVNEFLTLTEAAGWKVGQLLAAAIPGQYDQTQTGTAEKDGRQRPVYSYDFDTEDLIGAQLYVSVTIEADNKGTDRNRCVFIAKTKPSNTQAQAPAQASAQAPRAAAQAGTRWDEDAVGRTPPGTPAQALPAQTMPAAQMAPAAGAPRRPRVAQ